MGEIGGRCHSRKIEIITMDNQRSLTFQERNAILDILNTERVGCIIEERDLVYPNWANDTFILQPGVSTSNGCFDLFKMPQMRECEGGSDSGKDAFRWIHWAQKERPNGCSINNFKHIPKL